MADQVVVEATADFRRTSDATTIANSNTVGNVEPKAEVESGANTADAEDESGYPKGPRLCAITAALSIVLIALGLDIAIVAVTIPALSDAFQSIQDIGWYSTALRLVMCAFMFMFGKAYTLFSIKWLFLLSLAAFEIGNVICTFAQSSIMFIVGRAICGFGCAGLSGGVFTIFTHSFPLRQRALVGGIGGAIETLAATAAPLIGGGLISGWTWRACFGINIPLGVIGCGVIFFFLKLDPNPDESLPLGEKLKKLDLPGTAVFAPSIVCLLLALQWGGTKFAWSDARMIVLFVLFGVLLATFFFIEWKAGENALLPYRILSNRSLLSGAFFAMCINAVVSIVEYYMSIYFQGVRGYSAAKTGVFALPMIIGMCISAPLSGAFTTLIGHNYPSMYVGSVLSSVAVGVLTTIKIDTSLALVLCMVAIASVAFGASIQAPQVAAQTFLSKMEASIGIGIVQFGCQIGPVIFIAASAALFTNRLGEEIEIYSPSTNGTSLENVGLTEIRTTIDSDDLGAVLTGYNEVVIQTLYLPLALACISTIGAILMERTSVKQKKPVDKEEKVVKTSESRKEEGDGEGLEEKPEVRHQEAEITTLEEKHTSVVV